MAGSGVTGDFTALARFAQSLDRMASPGTMRELAKVLSEEALDLTSECFSQGTDPWGVKWLPLRMRAGQPLRDTGRLQRSIATAVEADSFTVGTNLIYAAVHQYGATIKPVRARLLSWVPRGSKLRFFARQVTIPARAYLPKGSKLPPSWQAAFRAATEEFFGGIAEAA